MVRFSLRCTECAAAHAADMSALRCASCNAPLEVEYLASSIPPEHVEGPTKRGPGTPVPLPLLDAGAAVSLGEGGTPIVEMESLGGLLGLRRLYAKLELLNPTGSFKDRGSAVVVSVAKELGVEEIVEDSSGNAGASVAAYAAKAGIEAHVFAPASAPAAKLRQIGMYGARLHTVEGPREAATEAAASFASQRGLVYAPHNLSPYFTEGTKSFAYEVAAQLAHDPPGHVVVPVGNGSLYLGSWKGYLELRESGSVAGIPRLHCIQASAFKPLVAAYEGSEWAPRTGASTVAGGISSAAPPRAREILRAMRGSGGAAAAVGDEDILRWQRLLAESEGIYAEPTSAAALAGLERLVRDGTVAGSDTVVVPITGSGLKDTPS